MYVVSVWHWRVRSVADIRCFFRFLLLVGFFSFLFAGFVVFVCLFFTFLFEVTFNHPVAKKFRWTSSGAPKRKWCRQQASSVLWKSSVCEDSPGTLKNRNGAEPAKPVLIQQAFTSLHAPFKLQRTCNMPVTSPTTAVWVNTYPIQENSIPSPIINHTARVVYGFLVYCCVCRQYSYSEIATNLSLSRLF